MTERGDRPSSEPSVGHSSAEWTLASGSCLIGADKATPQKTVKNIRQTVMTQGYLSENQAAVR